MNNCPLLIEYVKKHGVPKNLYHLPDDLIDEIVKNVTINNDGSCSFPLTITFEIPNNSSSAFDYNTSAFILETTLTCGDDKWFQKRGESKKHFYKCCYCNEFCENTCKFYQRFSHLFNQKEEK
jgi:hypothetical protein